MMINGRTTSFPQKTQTGKAQMGKAQDGKVQKISLVALLRAQGMDPQRRGIAVALNGNVVQRSDWADRMVSDADAVEIVTALPGG